MCHALQAVAVRVGLIAVAQERHPQVEPLIGSLVAVVFALRPAATLKFEHLLQQWRAGFSHQVEFVTIPASGLVAQLVDLGVVHFLQTDGGLHELVPHVGDRFAVLVSHEQVVTLRVEVRVHRKARQREVLANCQRDDDDREGKPQRGQPSSEPMVFHSK